MELNLLSNIHGDLFDEETNIWQITIHPIIDEYGTKSCKDREFWQARQAFLSSYQFSQHDYTIRGKSKRSVKEIGEVVFGVVSEFYHQRLVPIRRKIVVKRFKIHLVRSSLFFIVRCFIPRHRNKEYKFW